MTLYDKRESFFRAHNRARREEMLARLSGKPTSLLPFEVLTAILKSHEQVPHRQAKMIPLDKIAGSVGRYRDFTRDFLPKSTSMADRWARVEQAMESLEGTPPIEVFRIGGVYFVGDGNHRVSVARACGFDSIEAHVTDIAADCDLEPGDSLDQAIMKAEHARFLAETRLNERVSFVDIYFTRPGGFVKLLEHVHIHRRLLSQDRGGESAGEISLGDAALDWYEKSYCPIIQAIRDRQLLQRFPGRTAADLYVWIWDYIFDAYRRLGQKLEPEDAAAMLEQRAPSAFQQAVQGLMNRVGEASRVLVSGGDRVPDWVNQTFEWEDGSLSELGDETNEAVRGE